jgi:hypothetical protein
VRPPHRASESAAGQPTRLGTGDVAQLVEHRLCTAGVEGSSPFVSTTLATYISPGRDGYHDLFFFSASADWLIGGSEKGAESSNAARTRCP